MEKMQVQSLAELVSLAERALQRAGTACGVLTCWFMIAGSRKLTEPTKQPWALRSRDDGPDRKSEAQALSTLD
jgi:hypothetical protein